MNIQLRTHAAVERAEAERERIEEKVAAFEEFGERVSEVSADAGQQVGGASGPTRSAGSANSRRGQSGGSALAGSAVAAGATASGGTRATADAAETVREAFAETVLPYADADTLSEAMADELSAELAAALSPAAGGFTPGLKGQLLSRVESRTKECGLLADAIGTERDRIQAVADELDAATDWLAEADETPLLQLGFEELRERHDRLAEFRETCTRLAGERQSAVRGTQNDGLTGIRESELLDHLYADFEDDHPVLADLARLDDALADCQRAVRKHLCARV
ncbi:DUF7260 family protein [Halorussus ruber]|uniref:DUF7260 family protein n=1 Tax=Halorussus ruber TaxID=1126238 RepID=UPI0010919999|nr:hypothetical protein [Halorussus ruber]